MSSQRRFWLVASVALAIGVPLALTARQTYTTPQEHEHSDGGDAATGAALQQSTGATRAALLKQALQDPAPAKRLAAAEALEEERGEQRATLLKLALQDNDSTIRMQAVHALFRNPDKAAQELMRAALRDDDTWVRQAALQGLSVQTGPQLAELGSWLVPDLMERLDDTDATTHSFAIAALRKRTQNPWHYSPRASANEAKLVIGQWKVWWASQKATFPAVPAALAIVPERTDPAPNQVLRTIDGAELSPAKGGQLTLINFWGTWCPPCRGELPSLQQLHERYSSRGVTVVGVALAETGGAASLRTWCAQNKLTYPQVLAEETLTEAYGDVHEVPVTVLVDAQGQIRYRWSGERDLASFQRALDRIQQKR